MSPESAWLWARKDGTFLVLFSNAGAACHCGRGPRSGCGTGNNQAHGEPALWSWRNRSFDFRGRHDPTGVRCACSVLHSSAARYEG